MSQGRAAGVEIVTDLGAGPPIVLLHGVGVGPASLGDVADRLAEAHRVLVVRRPDPVPGGMPLVVQAALVVAAVGAEVRPEPIVVAGASGGATLALATAIAAPSAVSGVVAHEPLLGTHAPELHRRVASARLRLESGDLDAVGWFVQLVGGSAWARLDGRWKEEVQVAAPTLADDVAPFADWEPSTADLDALRGKHIVTTVGGDSGTARRAAAAALAELTGAKVVTLGGADHLAPLSAPIAFAEVVAAVRARSSSPAPVS